MAGVSKIYGHTLLRCPFEQSCLAYWGFTFSSPVVYVDLQRE